METQGISEITVYIKYVDSLRHWKDAIFNVPTSNVVKVSGSDPKFPPLVGDRVIVRHAGRSGRVRKWNGIVVLELDILTDKRLLEMNEIDDDDKAEVESPVPPGNITPSPQRKRSRLYKV